jgi:hypothetical protein
MDRRRKALSVPLPRIWPLRRRTLPPGVRLLLSSLLILSFLFVLPAGAQIHGTPASVTSLGPRGEIRGIPASVTSLGPLGWQAPRYPLPPGFHPRLGWNYGQRRRGYGYTSLVPYAVPVYPYAYDDPAGYGAVQATYMDGAPLPATDPRAFAAQPAPADPQPAPAPTPAMAANNDPRPEPKTLLVFLDGHRLEVGNYAIVGDKLYDLSGGRRHTIPLSELDLPTTQRENEDRGTDFLLPAARKG